MIKSPLLERDINSIWVKIEIYLSYLIQKDLALCSLGENPWLCNRAGVQINKVNYGDKVTMTDNHWLMSSADRPLWGKGDFNHFN